MGNEKLVTSVDTFRNLLAFDPARVILATWESGDKLRLWFGGDITPPVVLEGAVAQRAWERIVALQKPEVG
jgi:hypothetical protein